MSGHHSWSNLQRAIDGSPKRRARVDRDKQIMRDVSELARLREARGVTQEEIAHAWERSQSNVSQVEHRDDIYLSTLRSYVEALGGRLEINAVFPDQTITLGGDPATRQNQQIA